MEYGSKKTMETNKLDTICSYFTTLTINIHVSLVSLTFPAPPAATGKDAKKDTGKDSFVLPPPPYRVNFVHDLKGLPPGELLGTAL